MKSYLAVSLLALATAFGCNTTKTDSRAQEAPVTGSNSSSQSSGAPGVGVIAGPSVGAITSVSPPVEGVAADFAWTDARGEHRLSDYRGRVVMINFWGTWCPPCRRELPALIKIREELAPEKFEIIGINIGERPPGGTSVESHVISFASKNNIRYPLVIGDENLVNAYGGIQVVPTTFIIDGNGRIIERIEGSRDEAGFRAVINRAM